MSSGLSLPEGDDWQKGDETDMTEIRDCYCPSCGSSSGVTLMLPTKIPLFREIVVISFQCEECFYRNTEVNFGGALQPLGETLTFTVTCPQDVQRQIIKSESAALIIPSLDFEIPPETQRGSITTLEGILKRAADNLEVLQPERLRLGDVDNFHRCRKVIRKLRLYADSGADAFSNPDDNDADNHAASSLPEENQGGDDDVDDDDEDDDDDDEEDHANETKETKKKQKKSPFPFQIILHDIAGNSFIENTFAPSPDPNLVSQKFERTPTQDMQLGLQPSQQARESGYIDDANPQHKHVANAAPSMVAQHPIEIHKPSTVTNHEEDAKTVKQEVIKFSTDCPSCFRKAETDMCVTDIPHFKEIIIMSLVCESCGYRSNEIKGGGAIPKFGTQITLRVQTNDDLQREVLKSDTAGLRIPEIDLELEEGGLDGLYTTVEGLLNKVHARLKEANPFGTGDSAYQQHLTNDGGEFSDPSPTHVRYAEFLKQLKALTEEDDKLPFTLIITDPLSNSFVGPIPKDAIALAFQAEQDGNHDCYQNYVDPNMELKEFERSHDQNEILGLNDMKTENYQLKSYDANVEILHTHFGTDEPVDLPDRLRRPDIRGPDHPHSVGKAPVEGDNTVMGPGSVNHAVPAMLQRGSKAAPTTDSISITAAMNLEGSHIKPIAETLIEWEKNDKSFVASQTHLGHVEGKVFKTGAQGIGYYSNVALMDICS